MDQAFRAWNMLENGVVKHMLPIIFPTITYKEKLYLPRLFKKINM